MHQDSYLDLQRKVPLRSSHSSNPPSKSRPDDKKSNSSRENQPRCERDIFLDQKLIYDTQNTKVDTIKKERTDLFCNTNFVNFMRKVTSITVEPEVNHVAHHLMVGYPTKLGPIPVYVLNSYIVLCQTMALLLKPTLNPLSNLSGACFRFWKWIWRLGNETFARTVCHRSKWM